MLERIELIKNETKLFASLIENDGFNNQNRNYKSNEAAALFMSLRDRNAINEIRWKVFSDSEYATKGKKSAKVIIENNCQTQMKFYEHQHFLKWIKYFIFGPDLPQCLILKFSHEVKNMGDLTSGDVYELQNFTRTIVCQYRIQNTKCDEFFKLALEFEPNDVDFAKSLRKIVRDTRF
ncbi:MAG: hypothetical protein ACPGVT_10385 [Maricaulaceae bacterium]